MDNNITWQGATVQPLLGRCDFEIEASFSGFRRGDANSDGTVNISDATAILSCKFLGTSCSDCRDAADTNDDGAMDVSDAVRLLGFLYLGAPSPPAPGPVSCGPDPTDDSLPDCSYSRC